MKRTSALLGAAVLLLTAAAFALPAAAGGRSGYYLAGKGGPSVLGMSQIDSSASVALNDDSAVNMVGAFGMAGGYNWSHFGLPLRTEVELMNRTEVTFNSNPLLTTGGSDYAVASTVQNVSLMLRGAWYFHVGDPNVWSPFVSAGVGVARNAVKGNITRIAAGASPEDLDNVTYAPAWSVGAGASFYLGNNVVNDVALRYVDNGKADWGIASAPNLTTDHLRGLELIFALRYNF